MEDKPFELNFHVGMQISAYLFNDIISTVTGSLISIAFDCLTLTSV